MPDDCTRVKQVVRAWARVPADVPISTARVLTNLWIQFGPSLPFCATGGLSGGVGVEDLINSIIEEFPELKIRLRSSDFCPPESAALRVVGDICAAVSEAEPK